MSQGYPTGNVVLSVPKDLIMEQTGKNALIRVQFHKSDLITPQLFTFAESQGHLKRLTSQHVHTKSDLACLDLFDVFILRFSPGSRETRLVRCDEIRAFCDLHDESVAYYNDDLGFPLFSCIDHETVEDYPKTFSGISCYPRFVPEMENGSNL